MMGTTWIISDREIVVHGKGEVMDWTHAIPVLAIAVLALVIAFSICADIGKLSGTTYFTRADRRLGYVLVACVSLVAMVLAFIGGVLSAKAVTPPASAEKGVESGK